MNKQDIEELAIKCGFPMDKYDFKILIPKLEAFIAALSQPQEAVARVTKDGKWFHFDWVSMETASKVNNGIHSLFTAPPNYEAEIRTLRNQCVTLTEENERLREALDACLLMCDFSSIPAIEKNVREALKEGE